MNQEVCLGTNSETEVHQKHNKAVNAHEIMSFKDELSNPIMKHEKVIGKLNTKKAQRGFSSTSLNIV